ncbi:O-acetylserine/cysteine exporter [Vibrio diazotrophicus]|uniref:O-acetylserine/cysteine exporter n=1 Tax=Vibrio diazotrophicus TaxID=685 RepID=A0A2J8I5M8_VIBDI|nr:MULTISPECIES: EamA family transporter [Vibrio]MCF7361577.1 EamA family transporter [Vibrio sp. A1-b2]PNI05825.1 O-acetylserine/cysteine exporter [Vibrio diazotrophicus]
MSVRDRFLALAIVLVWGVNFVVIKIGLQGMPPLLLAGLRFAFVALPAIFFIKRPQVPLKWLVAYGLTINFLQFSLLFWALKVGMAAGLASLLLQAQAFITLGFGVLLLKEKVRIHNMIAVSVAGAGIYLLAAAQGHDSTSLTLFTLVLIIGAAAFWALGNIVNKVIMQRYPVPTMSLIVWSALVPMVSFFISSYVIEGPELIAESLVNIEWHNVFSIVYLSLLATILGYGGWSYLLSRYETSMVAPLSLLVPVFGLLSAWILLGESLSLYQIIGVIVIAMGLVINVFGKNWFGERRVAKAPALDK